MLKVIVIAGTAEARHMIAALGANPLLEVHATVTTDYGRLLLESGPAVRIHQGQLDETGMRQLFEMIGAHLVVDVTHPFAVEASRNAYNACQAKGIRYLRYEREATPELPGELIRVPDFTAAAQQAEALPGNILLTTGSNHLEVFLRQVSHFQERLYVRVLPIAAVVQKCEALGLAAGRIIALQGPFSEAMNRALLEHCQAKVLVTKDSGVTGGNVTKLAAARRLQIPVIMVERPAGDPGPRFGSIDELLVTIQQLNEVKDGAISFIH